MQMKMNIYAPAVNAPCRPFIPGNTFIIIEYVVALLTAVKSGKVLLNVVILLRSDKPETVNDDLHVVLPDNLIEHADGWNSKTWFRFTFVVLCVVLNLLLLLVDLLVIDIS